VNEAAKCQHCRETGKDCREKVLPQGSSGRTPATSGGSEAANLSLLDQFLAGLPSASHTQSVRQLFNECRQYLEQRNLLASNPRPETRTAHNALGALVQNGPYVDPRQYQPIAGPSQAPQVQQAPLQQHLYQTRHAARSQESQDFGGQHFYDARYQ
jgi:hypothetical protein